MISSLEAKAGCLVRRTVRAERAARIADGAPLDLFIEGRQ